MTSAGSPPLDDRRAPHPTPGWVAGVDEVGRGAWFGPVVAAAVLVDGSGSPTGAQGLAADWVAAGVRDSKQLSARRREALVPWIQGHAIAWAIGQASVTEIDRLNILQATFLAMRRAIAQLDPQPHHCEVDGNRPIPDLAIPQTTLVGGDRQSVAIAAASILAKVWRDQHITALAAQYPGYDLAANKGYGTARHREALQTLGLTPQHRRSFAPCRQLRLPL